VTQALFTSKILLSNYLDNISVEDVKLFFLKQTYESLFFFLRLWIFFVWLAVPSTAWHAKQSTHLAEGLNPL